jgi:hypothetical protein
VEDERRHADAREDVANVDLPCPFICSSRTRSLGLALRRISEARRLMSSGVASMPQYWKNPTAASSVPHDRARHGTRDVDEVDRTFADDGV